MVFDPFGITTGDRWGDAQRLKEGDDRIVPRLDPCRECSSIIGEKN